mmetsp:Transcript_47735/g.113609  ORF Transcript_47735/g.113609 Transcript_47735/m.113609 type:complete len:315 (+) Transcript_47735:466-1410(+)
MHACSSTNWSCRSSGWRVSPPRSTTLPSALRVRRDAEPCAPDWTRACWSSSAASSPSSKRRRMKRCSSSSSSVSRVFLAGASTDATSSSALMVYPGRSWRGRFICCAFASCFSAQFNWAELWPGANCAGTLPSVRGEASGAFLLSSFWVETLPSLSIPVTGATVSAISHIDPVTSRRSVSVPASLGVPRVRSCSSSGSLKRFASSGEASSSQSLESATSSSPSSAAALAPAANPSAASSAFPNIEEACGGTTELNGACGAHAPSTPFSGELNRSASSGAVSESDSRRRVSVPRRGFSSVNLGRCVVVMPVCELL